MKETIVEIMSRVLFLIFISFPANLFIVWLLAKCGIFAVYGFGDISFRQMCVVALLGTVLMRA